MSCISWNCRGLGNPEAVQELRNIVKQELPLLLFVMETKISAKRVESLQHSLGFAGCFAVSSTGLSGGIGLFWSRDVDVELKNFSSAHIDVVVRRTDQVSPIWRFTVASRWMSWCTKGSVYGCRFSRETGMHSP